MAETNGLLNRRTGKSGTEGSNPSVSAKNIGTLGKNYKKWLSYHKRSPIKMPLQGD